MHKIENRHGLTQISKANQVQLLRRDQRSENVQSLTQIEKDTLQILISKISGFSVMCQTP